MPERMHVALGSGEERSFFTRDYLAYYRRLRASFLARAGANGTYPNECGHCKVCDWERTCDRQRRDDDHLSLVAWMRRDQVEKLTSGGVATLTQLASAVDDARPFGFNPDTFASLRLQASLQVAGRTARKHHLLPYEARGGLALLPEPNAGDVYFDMEGDPYFAPDTGLEYLFGAYLPNEDRYVPFWAASAALEKRAMTGFFGFRHRAAHALPQPARLPLRQLRKGCARPANDALRRSSRRIRRSAARRRLRGPLYGRSARHPRFGGELLHQEARAVLRIQAQGGRGTR